MGSQTLARRPHPTFPLPWIAGAAPSSPGMTSPHTHICWVRRGPTGLLPGDHRPLPLPCLGLWSLPLQPLKAGALPPGHRPLPPSALCISKREPLLLSLFLIRMSFAATQSKAQDSCADTWEHRQPVSQGPTQRPSPVLTLTHTHTHSTASWGFWTLVPGTAGVGP